MGKCKLFKLKKICKLNTCCLDCKERCNLEDKCLVKFRRKSGKHLEIKDIQKRCSFYIKDNGGN